MKTWTAPLVLAAIVAAAQPVSAQSNRSYFPLSQGNSWTHQHQPDEMETYLSVSDSFNGIYQVSGIPGAQSGLWVTWGGSTLYAWRPSTRAWVPFLRFGATAGTTWRVTLDYPFWNNAEVQLKVRGFDSYDPYLDQTFRNCIHFVVLGDVENGSPKEMVFAPNVGMIFYSNWLDGDYDRFFLTSGVLNGARYGLIRQQDVEAGSQSGWRTSRTNVVLLVNSQTAWQSFYAVHNPGVAPPRVDFNRQTVVVVLAGRRPTGGYSVSVPRVTWMWPTRTARISVREQLPFETVIQGETNPFAIAILEEKFYRAMVDWRTWQPRLPR